MLFVEFDLAMRRPTQAGRTTRLATLCAIDYHQFQKDERFLLQFALLSDPALLHNATRVHLKDSPNPRFRPRCLLAEGC